MIINSYYFNQDMIYDKLVRDNIPDIIKSKGKNPVSHIATSDEEFEPKLHDKLREEIEEFLEDETAEELADVMEVLDTIRKFHGIAEKEVKNMQQKKAKERGTFSKRIILDETN